MYRTCGKFASSTVPVALFLLAVLTTVVRLLSVPPVLYACADLKLQPQAIEASAGKMRFQGFVMSDWWATHSSSAAGLGLDQELPGPPAGANPGCARDSNEVASVERCCFFYS